MALESAKCPNCAADIQVPNEQEDTFCSYCGSQIKTRAAIGYFQVELKGKVQIDIDPAVQAKLQRGRETGEIQYFKEALDLDPSCGEARKEIVKADLTDCHYNLSEINNGNLINRTLYGRIKYLMDCHPIYKLRDFDKWVNKHSILWNPYELFGTDFFILDMTDRKEIIDLSAKKLVRVHLRNGKLPLEIPGKDLLPFANSYTYIRDYFDDTLKYIDIINYKDLFLEDTADMLCYCLKSLCDEIKRVPYIEKKYNSEILQFFEAKIQLAYEMKAGKSDGLLWLRRT